MMFFESLNDYNPRKERKMLIMFDDMIADIEGNKRIVGVVLRYSRWICF